VFEINDAQFENIGKIVNSYIKDHEAATLPLQIEGDKYYRTKNPDIMKRKIQYYSQTKKSASDDPYRANNKVASSFIKLLVDQKLSYSINDGMSIDSEDADLIMNTLKFKTFRKYLRKVAKDACNKYYGVLQFYINAKGELDYKHIPAEEVIRIPNADDPDITDAIIRYYSISYTDHNGKTKTAYKAEYYDNDLIWYYIKLDDSEKYVVCDERFEPENPKPHLKRTTRIGERVESVEAQSWGMPPFAIVNNNDERQRDMDPVLPLIRVWDIVTSDFANNLEDFQDVYWVLKNYGGQDVDEFFEELRRYKTIKTDENGDARAEQVQIPVEARQKMLDILEKMIFKFGRGVNADDIQGDVTNVRIYSLYSGLDLKANEFEMELQDFFDQVQFLLGRYLDIKNLGAIKDPETGLRFKRAMVLNKKEIVETLTMQKGFLSLRTLLELHPDIHDVDEELKRIQEEADAQASLFMMAQPDLDGDEDAQGTE